MSCSSSHTSRPAAAAPATASLVFGFANIEVLTFDEYVANTAVAREEVAFGDDQVRQLARLDAARDALEAEDLCRCQRYCAERFVRAQPCFNRAAHPLAEISEPLETVCGERHRNS